MARKKRSRPTTRKRSPDGIRIEDGVKWERVDFNRSWTGQEGKKQAQRQAQQYRDRGLRAQVKPREVKTSTGRTTIKHELWVPMERKNKLNRKGRALMNQQTITGQRQLRMPSTPQYSRRYNSEVAQRGLFWRIGSYLFGNPKRASIADDAAVSEDVRQVKARIAAGDAGFTDLASGLTLLAEEKKMEEQRIALEERLAAETELLKLEKREEESKRYKRETEQWRQGINTTTFVKYNSLEIGGGISGGLIGSALVAATSAAALPLGILLGIGFGKFLRWNRPIFGLNPRRVTNNAIDVADYISKNTLEALETSKDHGKGWLIRRPKELKKPKKPKRK